MSKISVIICTRDRPDELERLLQTLLIQTYSYFEIIIVDESVRSNIRKIAEFYEKQLMNKLSCTLRLVKGRGASLSIARNIGVQLSEGDLILFLDDDTILDKNVLYIFAYFMDLHKNALGVQGQMYTPTEWSLQNLHEKIDMSIYKVFMLSYCKRNTLSVRRSGTSVFPYCHLLTADIEAERLDGWCMCYRRKVFNELSFDGNLKRWAFMEDLDFSFRLHKKYPRSLFVTPRALIEHKKSEAARLPKKTVIEMLNIYWFYVFFKDIFDSSILNLASFLWAVGGNALVSLGGLIIKRKSRVYWWEIIYMLNSYLLALRHLSEIKLQNLRFFNAKLGQ